MLLSRTFQTQENLKLGATTQKTTTKREDKVIIEGALKDRRKTSKLLANKLRETSYNNISERKDVEKNTHREWFKLLQGKEETVLTMHE